ncbi:MAG: hypothetical protein H8D77_02280 [Chloroflexi bacterium]|nr:hypothetical protein [Chloroflexota bacterium]MBL7202072.1 hypothetical protein [Anaerolineae bacterium]
MGAEIVLTGQAKDIQKHDRSITCHIIAGPAAKQPPRGLKLFGQTLYQVECTIRQWRRARQHANDHSDLTVEGYLEPRRDSETGRLYIAVIATSVQSALLQNVCKLEQLEQVLQEARDAFVCAREQGVDQRLLEEKAARFVEASECVGQFLERHPELIPEKRI